MICRVCRWWARCWGRNSVVVRNIGQVRHEFACGQVCTKAARSIRWAALGWPGTSRCLAHAASASGPSGSRVTVWPWTLTLRACFPVAADGGVGQPGVVGRHLRRVVVEDLPDDLLRDIPVDQTCSQGVSPLVRGQVHRSAVFVADVAALQPLVERVAVGAAAEWRAAGQVGRGRGNSTGVRSGQRSRRRRCCWSICPVKFVVDGDERFAFHLVVEVAQVGGAVGVERRCSPQASRTVSVIRSPQRIRIRVIRR